MTALSSLFCALGVIIGISSGYDERKVSLKSDYTNSIFKAGGVPFVLPLVHDASSADAVVSAIDGLLLSGGEDVNPARYGENVLNSTVSVNHVRDTSDFLLLDAARRKGIPVLGVCRGAQLTNVYLGGDLWQDLPSQKGSDISHKQNRPSSEATHMVGLEKGSLLRDLVGRDSLAVNSFHHQAVKTVAPSCKVSAIAPDGVVEGFEGDGILCVQFHPEGFINAGYKVQLPIYVWLVEQASKKKKD